jgi:O-antigen/teichoic acid export membrane protein
MGVTIVLARYLGAESYGLYQRAEALVLLFAVVANLGLDMILTREVARDPAAAGRSFWTVAACKVGLSFLALAGVLLLVPVRGYEGTLAAAIRLFGVLLVVNALVQTADAVMQGVQAMRELAAVTVFAQIVWTAGALACVWGDQGLLWIIGALIVSAMAHLVVALVVLHRQGVVRFQGPRWERARYYLREALPLAFAASFVILYQQIDAVMLGDLRGNAEVGWYKAGAKVLLAFSILRESFMIAVFPVLAALVREAPERVGPVFTRAVRYQIIVALLFILGLIAFSRVATFVFGPEFRPTSQLLPLLGWITIPQVVSITSGRTLIAAGYQNRLVLSTSLSLVANVGLNLFLIPRFGIFGAAWASIASECLVAGLNLYFVHRLVCRPQLVSAVSRPLVAAVLTAAVIYPLRSQSILLTTGLAIGLYALALALTRTFSADEIAQARGFLRSLWPGRAPAGPAPERAPVQPLERTDFEE